MLMSPLRTLIFATMASGTIAALPLKSCLVDGNDNFSMTLATCNMVSFKDEITKKISSATSSGKACRGLLPEMRLLFRNTSFSFDQIQTWCSTTQAEYASNNKVTMTDLMQGVFLQSPVETAQDYYQFFLGGTELNTDTNSPNQVQRDMLLEASQDVKTKVLDWPGDYQNFQQCSTQAVICCWADVPVSADNTDVCYVDNRAPYAGQVNGGFFMYPEDVEGPVNCHGFTFGEQKQLGSYRFRGNALFQLAVTYGLLDKGYSAEVAGAPMCSCADDAPAISNADCSEIKIDESYTFAWSGSANPTLVLNFKSVGLEACMDTNGNSIGLQTHYETMVNALVIKPSAVGKRPFNNTVVGDGKCRQALSTFLKAKSYVYN
jgi:hypothetical protein